MKRLLSTLLVLVGLAAVYGYVVIGRENSHRDLIRRGDAAMAAGDLSTAIEAFSGAIALKGDSMIGYLMRGDAYRRRDELEAALRDLRQAAEIDPGAPRPRELLGDVNYARHRYPAGGRPLSRRTSTSTIDRRASSTSSALARYRAGQPTLGIEALQKAVAIDENFAEALLPHGALPAGRAASVRSARLAPEGHRSRARRSSQPARNSPISMAGSDAPRSGSANSRC